MDYKNIAIIIVVLISLGWRARREIQIMRKHREELANLASIPDEKLEAIGIKLDKKVGFRVPPIINYFVGAFFAALIWFLLDYILHSKNETLLAISFSTIFVIFFWIYFKKIYLPQEIKKIREMKKERE